MNTILTTIMYFIFAVSDSRVGRSSSKSAIPVLRNSGHMRRKSSELKEGHECDELNDETNATETRQTRRSAHSFTSGVYLYMA